MSNSQTALEKIERDLGDRLFDLLNCFPVDAREISQGMTHIDSREARNLSNVIVKSFHTSHHSILDEAVERIEKKKGYWQVRWEGCQDGQERMNNKHYNEHYQNIKDEVLDIVLSTLQELKSEI